MLVFDQVKKIKETFNSYQEELEQGDYDNFFKSCEAQEFSIGTFLCQELKVPFEKVLQMCRETERIYEGMFLNCDQVPETLKIDFPCEIGPCAFQDCKYIGNVIIDYCKSLDDYCFYGCNELTNFVITDGIIYDLPKKCLPVKNLKRIILPKCYEFSKRELNEALTDIHLARGSEIEVYLRNHLHFTENTEYISGDIYFKIYLI